MINERIVIEEKTKDYNEASIETYFWQESEELYPGQEASGHSDLSGRSLLHDF